MKRFFRPTMTPTKLQEEGGVMQSPRHQAVRHETTPTEWIVMFGQRAPPTVLVFSLVQRHKRCPEWSQNGEQRPLA